ncbi:AcrR family transcriptional regulator [Desulfobaculum xiamenense]|uniref:AcrR family transcriptional regulator n=1 Tax=Desulfobaculum xiamenense TaxID=995050 RepID=A0A846QXB3_9BACT|nr:TetR/AcrR family transcriptional regulator [Desulfobaculum xiamenense]NJB69259.1 AcrR family transcriptional regulator [Desulfobaculum xiamenense]
MTRQKILEAAARLFSERGFANTPTSLLAREAGISEGSIYRHFSSKDEIFLQLVREVRMRFETSLREALEDVQCRGGLEQVSCVLEVYAGFVRENERSFSLIFRDAPNRAGRGDDEVQMQLQAIHDFILDTITKGLTAASAEGAVRGDIDIRTTAAMVCSLVLGMTRMRYFGFLSDADVGPQAVRRNLEILLRSPGRG